MNEERIIEYWESKARRGLPAIPPQYQSAEITTPGCNDTVRIDIRIENGIIKDALYSGKGCVLSQAGASMLTEALIGNTVVVADALREDFMFELFGGRPVALRMGCCILPLRVLHNAIQNHN